MVMAIPKESIMLDCFNRIIYIGNVKPDKTEARDTILVKININSQVKITKPNIIYIPFILAASPSKTPQVVDMPLPPLNRKNTVQLCPDIQLKPKIKRNASFGISKDLAKTKSPKKNTATKPLRISRTNTVIPGPMPKTRRAFVAPTFPEPSLRISMPFKTLPNI